MAQPLTCDIHAGQHLAAWLVTRLEDGESITYCDAAYAELMAATAQAMAQVEADDTAAAVEARLAELPPADETADVIPEPPDTKDAANGHVDPAELAPAVTVKRGQGPKAQAFRRRQAQDRQPEVVTVPDPPPGPDDPTDEPTDEPAT